MSYDNDGVDRTEWSQEEREYPEGFWGDIPKPSFWRVIVMPVKAKEVSRGGIVLAQSNVDAQRVLNFIGKIVALGPMAGKHERLGGDGTTPHASFPKVGEYVMFGRYAGQALTYRGARLLLVNDDEILGSVPNPEALTVSV